MIIHWQWLPLIITLVFYILFQLSGGDRELRSKFQLIMGGLTYICVIIDLFFYIVLGIAWLAQNIHII